MLPSWWLKSVYCRCCCCSYAFPWMVAKRKKSKRTFSAQCKSIRSTSNACFFSVNIFDSLFSLGYFVFFGSFQALVDILPIFPSELLWRSAFGLVWFFATADCCCTRFECTLFTQQACRAINMHHTLLFALYNLTIYHRKCQLAPFAIVRSLKKSQTHSPPAPIWGTAIGLRWWRVWEREWERERERD